MRTKKLFSALLLLCVLFTNLAISAFAEDAEPSAVAEPTIPESGDVWDGATLTQPSVIVNQNGINYYEISKCAELAFVVQTGGDWLKRNYILAENLILNEAVLKDRVYFDYVEAAALVETEGSPLHRWNPADGVFTGVFDGDGHVISGLYVNRPAGNGVGLLGNASHGATVRNLTVVNAYVLGSYFVGGIVGATYNATISDCVFHGTVMGTGDQYVGGITGGCDHESEIRNCTNYGTVVSYGENAGGITGSSDNSNVSNCANYGDVTGSDETGGIVGSSEFDSISNCVNHGTVSGNVVGGIAGSGSYSFIDSCVNYGAVKKEGSDYRPAGGIVGNSRPKYYDFSRAAVSDCINYGTVTGRWHVGGIVGNSYYSESYPDLVSVERCENFGAVSGTKKVGGIVGQTVHTTVDCCNAANVTGETEAGGVIGSLFGAAVLNCYTVGGVFCTGDEGSAGAVIGTDGAVWGTNTVSGCYYLKTGTVNSGLWGCSGIPSAELEPAGFFACEASDLKAAETYTGWDFERTWGLSPDRNGAYPYLRMEDELIGETPVVPIQSMLLGASAISIHLGERTSLTAEPSPANADVSSLTWTSEDRSVATVDRSGLITGIGVGSTTVTARCGELSATCVVTVLPRSDDEYSIKKLSVSDENGTALASIPSGRFLVTLEIKKNSGGGNTLICLAGYSNEGQYMGLNYAAIEGQSEGSTLRLTFSVDNDRGLIARIKAFPIASFDHPLPRGAVLEY